MKLGRIGVLWLLWMGILFGMPCSAQESETVASMPSDSDSQARIASQAVELAQQFLEDGKLDEALHFYQQAFQLFQQQRRRFEQAAVMSDMGVLYRRLGDLERSLALQQQAVAIFAELNNVAGKAKGLRRIGVLLRHRGDFEGAIAAQEEALVLFDSIDDRNGSAMILTNLGTIYGDLGRLEEARNYFERALTTYTRVNNQQGVSYTYGNLGQLHLYLGDSRQALRYLEQSLALKRALNDRGGQANTLVNLGTVYRNIGEFQQALTFYYQALDAYRGLYDNSGAAVALGHIGSVYEHLGDLERAAQFQAQSFELKKANGTPLQVAVALTDLASLSIKQQRFEEASGYLEEGLELTAEQELLLAQAHIYGQRGNLFLHQEQVAAAIADFTEALRLNSKAGSQKGQLEVYQYLGQAFRSRQDIDKAFQYYSQALRLAETLDDSNALWNIQYALGKIALQHGDPDKALQHFIASIQTLERMRSYLAVSELRQMFVRKDVNPYAEVIRLLLDKNEAKEALIYLERFKARTFLEVVAHGKPELQTAPDILQNERYVTARIQYLQERLRTAMEDGGITAGGDGSLEERMRLVERITDELATAKADYEELLLQIKLQYPDYYRLKIVDADEIRRLVEQAWKLVEPGVLLLEYFLDDDALHIWSIEQQRITHIAVPVKRAEVLEAVLQLRVEAGYYFSNRVYPLLHTLYNWCIAPVERQMRDKTIVGIVPFEVLHFVPFGALTSTVWTPSESEESGHFPPYLIDDYALFSLPSLSVLPVVRERRSRPPLSVDRQPDPRRYLFGLGNATQNLPGAEQEVLTITGQFDGSVGYTGEAATKQRLFDEAGGYEVVHLATHGVYDKEHPMFSYLELASEALYAREVFGLQLQADLVTLSGCETFLPQHVDAEALNALVSGDELVGFVRAFLFAGTPSVLSSLWRVNDEATQQLMESFYQELPVVGKAASLQKAARSVIHSTLEVGRRRPRRISLQHPFFWSSFVLIGDWK